MGDNSMFAAACSTEGKTAGWLPESYGFLRIHKVNNYYAMAEYQVVWPNAELWRGYYNAGDDGLKWSGWQPISTATPPQEFDLPLAEGFSKHYCASYCKTQEGMVTVALWIAGSGAANVETTIATLPEGFRPTELFRAEGIVDTGTIPSQNQCGITVNEYGQIVVQAKSAWGYVSSTFMFRAAN